MSELAEELYGARYVAIKAYVDILAVRGIAWGLIGPRERNRLWERHILNSAALHSLIPPESSVVDVGSGAGLPGVPLALLRPDLRLTLIEPLLRRFNFLTQTVDDLGITDSVSVIRCRADEHVATYDVVVARALAPLERLVRWCAPLRSSEGLILALKGDSAGDEVSAAAGDLNRTGLAAEVLSVRASPRSEPTTVVRITSA